jgi:Fic family protein
MRSISALTRTMNSYYSNLIEGQNTHPLDIERALKSDYSAIPETARRQRLAQAHLHAENTLSGDLSGHAALTTAGIRQIHAEVFAESEDFSSPGEFRLGEVQVGRHIPPSAITLLSFLDRFESVYGVKRSPVDHLIAVAAAHHRMLWVHPFEDGNGRAVRLQTVLALYPITRGLWSVVRGMARNRTECYRLLDVADEPRRGGDLDGRGSRSEAGLVEWCDWFLHNALDQVTFMTDLLQLETIRPRIEAMLAAWSLTQSGIRSELALPLHHVFVTGRTSRRDVLVMTGLEERTARAAVSAAIRVGLLSSETHRSPLEFAFPIESLALLLPGLYPEAAIPRTNF